MEIRKVASGLYRVKHNGHIFTVENNDCGGDEAWSLDIEHYGLVDCYRTKKDCIDVIKSMDSFWNNQEKSEW